MTEIDIWIKVFDKLGFQFIDEHCGFVSKINYLSYLNDDGNYNLYFDRETGQVLSLFIRNSPDGNQTTKQLFYGEYKHIFRDIKLELVNE
jgi:hypothetical protein